MPLYEYLCESCGRRSEVLQRMGEAPLTVCPHCGGTLKKLVSAPAFQFKGSGWYVTDYARGGGKEGAGEKADKAGEKAERAQKSEGGSSETGAATADKKADAPATKPAAADSGKGESGGSTPPPASPPKGD